MGRRRRKPDIPVTLALPAEAPTRAEIDLVLMAADAIVSRAGRNGVSLILKGSRSKKVRANEWDQVWEYGAMRQLTVKVISTKVDWCIHEGWLRLEHWEGIPLLFHSAKGWQRVKMLWVERLLGWFTDWQRMAQPQRVWPRLEDIDREIKLMLLAEVEAQQRIDLRPVLQIWARHEVKKVRQAINQTLQRLERPSSS